MRAIEILGLTKRFAAVPVLRDFCLSVAAAEAVCLFGPSGSGKTTVLRLIAGLERPDTGSITIGDTIVTDATRFIPPVARRIGMVFQDLALWPHMRVEKHLDFVLRGALPERATRRERITNLLDLCDLATRRRAYPGELSGGQQQRLAIARALANDPDILLLDEPLTNLEYELRDRFIAEFARRKENGATIVLATHERNEAEQITDRIVHMGV
jgi:iron(III) transport system ATP-binding protein